MSFACPRQTRADFVEINAAAQEFLERCGFATGNAAGNDQIEEPQIGRNIVSKAVRSNPAANVHANGAKLFGCQVSKAPATAGGRNTRRNPHSGLASLAMRCHTEIARSADHHLF